MPRLPGFCEKCGAVFVSPLRAERAGRENAFDVPAPCPSCGGSGRVPGELLTTVSEAVELFTRPGAGEDEVRAFLAILEEGPGPDGLREPRPGGEPGRGEALLLATARRAPAYREIARRVGDAPPPVRRGIGALLRRALEVAEEEPGDEDEVVDRAVRRLLDEEAVEPRREEVPDDVALSLSRLEDAGRNDPCPCGSGEKYKDCHWIEDLRRTRDRG